ncbi:protein disulfide-isomerase [Platysternon megacephalum]|uniref:Protein disulfide-isomerase n=1 Tax=Platysternon megacephalum TaxID=55544 RepID=A0A4D9EGX7_9SAUR|nr:protein disulfide-isomerase [Platysternon megacephalum]
MGKKVDGWRRKREGREKCRGVWKEQRKVEQSPAQSRRVFQPPALFLPCLLPPHCSALLARGTGTPRGSVGLHVHGERVRVDGGTCHVLGWDCPKGGTPLIPYWPGS